MTCVNWRKNLFNKLFGIKNNWVVFFDVFSKNGNGDSIRPLAEELRKHRPDMKFFFCDCKKNRLASIDMADEIITEGTLKFKYIYSRAKYVISPMGFPNKGKKRVGQFFVQTWHGSPIKKLYLSRDKEDKHYKRYARQFRNADIFCMQGEIPSKLLQEAIELNEQQFIKSGLPRNDILFKADENFKCELKKKLGLPADKKVIFYCPTWRRYDRKAVLPFDIERFKKELGDEYVILIRSHVGKHKWVNSKDEPVELFDNKFSFDGGEYPEATHLYLISDIMVSDYSSAVFDFALTRKPEILYIYDYEDYKKEFDLYFDYETFSPFPKVRTEEELLRAIKNCGIDNNKYEEFISEYLEYENGNASEQVVNMMLSKGNN